MREAIETDKFYLDLSKALGVWLKRQAIQKKQFVRDMDFTSTYGYNLINGRNPFSHRSWGRFMLVYGVESLFEIFRIAGLDPQTIHARKGVQHG